jgi:PAS domain S-box-containing protein
MTADAYLVAFEASQIETERARLLRARERPIHHKREHSVGRSPAGFRPADEELSLLFALSHDLACVIGLDGRFERVNPASEVCVGWTPDDLLARPFLDFVHPDDRADTAAQMGRIASGPAAIDYENRFRGKDGADRRLQWNAVFSPERQAICASARDVAGQKGLEGALIEASDREKGRMGRELHDGLCQNLAGIAALSATLARKLAGRGDPAAAAAAEITALLQQAIGDARDLARGLNAGGLAQMGLAAALEVLAANVEALHPVTCAFACDRRFPRLDPTVEAHHYRIAQEAVSNALAHGRGNRIGVSMRLRDGQGKPAYPRQRCRNSAWRLRRRRHWAGDDEPTGASDRRSVAGGTGCAARDHGRLHIPALAPASEGASSCRQPPLSEPGERNGSSSSTTTR